MARALVPATAMLRMLRRSFGSLFAFLIQPQFRCYNRISVYIAFISLFAIGLLLDRGTRDRLGTTGGKIGCGAVTLFLLAFGIFDETTPVFAPDYARAKQLFEQDERFVHSVDAVVPANSMVFQLPYMQFPEPPGLNKMGNYDLLRGYLHSEKLRWSYPAMKGEVADAWQRTVSAMPAADMLQALAGAGFSGIYLDRFGYADNGLQMEHDLSRVLDEGPLVANGRLLFFSLEHYATVLRNGMSDAEWQKYRDRFSPPLVVYDKGFYQEEVSPGRTWRWCSNQGAIRIFNVSSAPKHVVFEMSVAPGSPEYHLLQVTSPLFNKALQVDRSGVHIRETVVLPIGGTEMNFSYDAPPIKVVGDPRRMVFGIENLRLREIVPSVN